MHRCGSFIRLALSTSTFPLTHKSTSPPTRKKTQPRAGSAEAHVLRLSYPVSNASPPFHYPVLPAARPARPMPGSTDGVLSPRLRRRILTAATIAYVLYYLHGVRRLRLHHGQGDPDARSRMERILSRCPALSKGPLYWPPFYAPSALGQFLILGLKELRARFLSRSPYERTVCALKDGTQLGLDWAVPETPLDGAPVVVMLHGGEPLCCPFDSARSLTATTNHCPGAQPSKMPRARRWSTWRPASWRAACPPS